MDFWSIASRILSLFIIMAIGFIMNKVGVIDEIATARFTKLVLNITVPAQIITAFINNRGVVSSSEVISGMLIAACLFPVYALLGALLLGVIRVPKKQRGTYIFMCMFCNVGFMGYPVITAIFGEQAMIYAVLLNAVFNLYMFSVGVILIRGEKKDVKLDPKTLLHNVPLMASALSIVLFFTSIRFPEPLMTSLDYLGDVTTPVAMLVLGATIGSMHIRELLDDWRTYVFTAFRLLVIPGVIYLLLRLIPGMPSMMKGTFLILSAMPVATTATMMAIEYEGDVKLASKGIFFSTICSVLTIPLVAMLCQ